MDGPGSNTARSCGTLSTGPIAPSSAPEIFRETMALCWQASLNGFYTISIREGCEVLRATSQSSSEHVGQFCDLPLLRNLLEGNCPHTGSHRHNLSGPQDLPARGQTRTRGRSGAH